MDEERMEEGEGGGGKGNGTDDQFSNCAYPVPSNESAIEIELKHFRAKDHFTSHSTYRAAIEGHLCNGRS